MEPILIVVTPTYSMFKNFPKVYCYYLEVIHLLDNWI